MSAVGGIAPTLLGVMWMQVVIAIVMVGLRGYAASMRDGKLRWDFVWVALSLLTGVLASVFVTKAVFSGLGNHLHNLDGENIFAVLRWNYVAIYLGTISIALSKFAVTALLLEVQRGSSKDRWKRISLWVVCAIFTVFTLLEIFLTAFQCHPVNKVWQLTDEGKCPAQRAARAISFVHAITGGLTDIFLALFPITIVWSLQTSRKVKVGFCALMAIGCLPAMASFARYHLLHVIYEASDFSYYEGQFMIFAATEVGSLIIIGSIPPLRPLFMRVVYGATSKTRTTQGETYQVQSGYNTRGPSVAVPAREKAMVATAEENDGIVVSHSYQIATSESNVNSS